MKLVALFSLVTAISAQAPTPRTPGDSCSAVRYPPPSVRYPLQSGYKGHNFGAWTPPPPEHLYGIYHITHTSYEQWVSSLVNLRSERYPVVPSSKEFPAGSQSEIGSWSTCADPQASDCKDSNAISTLSGHNIPIGALGPTDTKYTAAWRYNATGTLEGKVGNLFAIVAWGQDHSGFDYFAQYQTGLNVGLSDSSAAINIGSRNEKGISPITYICLTSSLKRLAVELEDTELYGIVSQMKPLRRDGRRSGEGPVECDIPCIENKNITNRRSQRLQSRETDQMQHPLKLVNLFTIGYPLGYTRGHTLPWWGWMTMGLVFGLPLIGGLCVAVPVALCRNHRRRKLVRAERATAGPTRDRQQSSVAEPEMIQTA